MNESKKIISDILKIADVEINGSRDWDIQVHNDDLYSRVLSGGSLALGEAYMDGWWDSKELDQFFDKVLSAKLEKKIQKKMVWESLKAKLRNLQSSKRAYIVGEKHYDLGNDLYESFLDDNKQYTCGYWENTDNLHIAQVQKMNLICQKLGLKKGDRLLDIGCGWGTFAKFACENYGVEVVGITISKEQLKYAQNLCKGLPIDIRFQDYRELDEKFDHIISIGMFEAVGPKNYKTYFEVINRCLKDEGLFLLHTIGGNISTSKTNPWIDKYIFPNGVIPSSKQICSSSEKLLIIEDWHNFGPDYYKTLIAWFDNFDNNWNQIEINYNKRFYRMWKYYLLSCAGSFRCRKNQLWQIVFSKGDLREVYKSIR